MPRIVIVIILTAACLIQIIREFRKLGAINEIGFIAVKLFPQIEANPIHLTVNQMHSARRLLNNPALPTVERTTIRRVLFVSHEKWAVKQAKEFKTLHRYKCRDISLDELAFAGKVGLFKSSQKYDGRIEFVRFSEIYVKSELLNAMTSRLSTTSCLSKRERMSSKTPTRSLENDYKRVPQIYRLDTFNDCVASSELTPVERYQTTEFINIHTETIQSCNNVFVKRAIMLKWWRHPETNKPLSNSRIAELMCCSEETVRKTAINIRKGLNDFDVY